MSAKNRMWNFTHFAVEEVFNGVNGMWIRNWLSIALVFFLFLGLFGIDVHAYNMHAKGTVHESMTLLAEDCLAQSGEQQPSSCDYTELENKIHKNPLANFTDMQLATRWPDDPTRMLNNTGIVKFVTNMLGGCESRIQSVGPDMSRRAELGLLCNSHFGDLQFMHSMASSKDEEILITKESIKDWARLTYRVATGAIDSSEPYCTYFTPAGVLNRTNHRETYLKGIAPVLLAAGKPYCADRPKKFLGIFKNGKYPAWRVHTLFSMTCRKPFSEKVCTEKIGPLGVSVAKNNSTGALLHLVQDSYSLSHASRSSESINELEHAKVVCQPIIKFHEYTNQQHNKIDHGIADGTPIFECPEGVTIHDPITASANILWLIKKGTESTEKRMWEDRLIIYLNEKVLG